MLGGALFINGVDHPVSLIDVIFMHFTATFTGGAIVVMDVPKHNRITIYRTVFQDCDVNGENSTYGGGLSVINSYVRIIESTFRHNGHLVKNGGAIALMTHEYLGKFVDERVDPEGDIFNNAVNIAGVGFFDNEAATSTLQQGPITTHVVDRLLSFASERRTGNNPNGR